MNYTESGGRFPRELFWAGDGVQIWLQLLLHLWRHRAADVVLLDEPEVFLHADLQRRLVSVLDSHQAQTVLATHSSEVIAEAPTDAVVWASRTRRRSVRSPKPAVLAELHKTLGSGFNMDLARTLKARAVVFVEGSDMKVLRLLAVTLQASNLAVESRVATISLDGFDRWDRVEQFQWLTKDLLGGRVPVYVLLDRDWRVESEVDGVITALHAVSVDAHIWRRHELESYLVSYDALSRI